MRFNSFDAVTLSTDDAYEDNDTFATAYDLSPFQNTRLSELEGLGRQFDEDWYKISIAPGQRRLTAGLEFAQIEGDLDLELYDATQNFVASSVTTTDNEQLGLIVPTEGDYYLKVHFSDVGNSYDLRWDSEAFLDDAYENNNDQASAYDLSLHGQTWLADLSGLGVAGDTDWYQITVTSGNERVIADLQLTTDGSGLKLNLYDSAGNVMLGSSPSPNNERIDAVVPVAGTYYLQVNTTDVFSGDTYNLRWGEFAFEDDAYEENNAQTSAYDLSSHADTWLTDVSGGGISGNADWYQIDLAPGTEHLTIDLAFVHNDGDLELTLYDANGNYVTGASSVTDDERIDTLLPSGTYYVEVDNSSAYTGNTYDLRWNGTRFEDDAYEENDTLDAAYDLSDRPQTWLSRIAGFGAAGDEDWYEINLAEGFENLVVDLNFTHTDGDLTLNIYDAVGDYVTASFSATDHERIDAVFPDAGTYYLQVEASGDYTGNPYDLRWESLPFEDDAYEDNDELLGAYDLSANAQTWLSDLSGLGVAGDEDWYKVDVAQSGDQLVVDLRFIHANGDLDLNLYDADGTFILGSSSLTDNEQLAAILPEAGSYYLGVTVSGSLGTTNVYDLRWDTQTVS